MSLASIDETLLQENTLRAFEELRFDDAVRMLEPLAWARQDPELLNNLGALYFQLDWAREAEAAFRQALALDPCHPAAVLNLSEQFIHYHLPWAALRVIEAAEKRSHSAATRQQWAGELAALRTQLSARRVSLYLSEGHFSSTASSSESGSPAPASTSGQEGQAATASEPTSLRQAVEACLSHLFEQSYPIHEVLVQEHTPLAKLLRELSLPPEQAALFRFLQHSELPGRQTFGNLALKRCNGEYFAHLTLDMRSDPTWLERAMAHMLNPDIGAVGTRQLSERPDRLLERWLSETIGREHGARQLQNPACLGEPGGLYRVSALKRIGGWNSRWASLSEEVERSSRLMEAGFSLRYESSALFTTSFAPSLAAALRQAWHLRCLNRMDAHVYERMERTAAGLSQNSTMALRAIAAFLSSDRVELLYPSFLSYYAWTLFDVQQVNLRRQLTQGELSQTCAAVYLVARHHLRNTVSIPARVVERTLQDLETIASELMLPAEQRFLNEQAERLDSLPDHSVDLDALLEGLQQLLPQAHHLYLATFAEQRFLSSLGHGMGTLLEKSVETLEAEEVYESIRQERQPHAVLFNPPARGFGGITRPGGPATRWLSPSRQQRLIQQLRQAGAMVSQLDAVALKLDARLAEARLMALKPSVIVYNAQEGGLERMVAAARRIKLVGPAHIRQILVHAGSVAEQPLRRTYAMFDEVYAEDARGFTFPS